MEISSLVTCNATSALTDEECVSILFEWIVLSQSIKVVPQVKDIPVLETMVSRTGFLFILHNFSKHIKGVNNNEKTFDG